MIDFHIHIGFGPAALLPAEALRLAALAGCRAVGLILRVDGAAALPPLLPLRAQIRELALCRDIDAFLGVELVHTPPALLPDYTRRAREAGAELVLAHGETLADTLPGASGAGGMDAGVNFAAVEAGVDILAHPGLIDEQAAAYAAEKGVALELTSCPRHGLANAHVARLVERFEVPLVWGSNARSPEDAADLLARGRKDAVCRGAGLSEALTRKLDHDSRALAQRLLRAAAKA